jgi:hypothetical protein
MGAPDDGTDDAAGRSSYRAKSEIWSPAAVAPALLGLGAEDQDMFTLSVFEAAALGIGLLAIILLLVAGGLVAFPRATHRVPATVDCPLLHRRAGVELVRDAWTLRFVDVARCSALGGYAAVICSRRCLAGGAARPLVRAS